MGILHGDLLVRRHCQTGKQHIQTLDEDVAFDLYAAVCVRVDIARSVLRRALGNNVKPKGLLKARNQIFRVNGNVTVIFSGIHLDRGTVHGTVGAIRIVFAGKEFKESVDRFLDRILDTLGNLFGILLNGIIRKSGLLLRIRIHCFCAFIHDTGN